MTRIGLTYQILQNMVKKRIVSYALWKGPTIWVLPIWVVVAGVLGVILELLTMAGLWTVLCLGIGGFMFWSYLRNPAAEEKLIRLIVNERFKLAEIESGTLREAASEGIRYFTEIALKIVKIARKHGEDDHLSNVLRDADGMISLQFESAQQVTEFERVLDLVQPGRSGRRKDDAGQLFEENVAAIRKATAEARTLVAQISDQLRTLTLQVVQMEQKASDRVRTARFAEEAESTLRDLQAQVTARRETADEVIRRMAPMRA